MIIKEALAELAELAVTASPVVKLMHTGIAFNVIVLAFKKDMILKEHKSIVPTKLIVFDGKIKFASTDLQKIIDKYDELEIPLEKIYSLEALEDALCLLIQGYRN
ncbi:hypothetical protein ACFQZF_09175 [Flavobacterium myungsuense]|uniref:Uncharacterized protein n=1 Tax=Flavobacterium myungsuense TaxID=651823 RepID=A0ABW3J1C0_9FLAO